MTDKQENVITIIYDGECPVCTHYVNGVRLSQAAGLLRLQSARDETLEILELKEKGYDLNKGMIVKANAQIYYGAAAMHVISMMTTQAGIWNRLLFFLFRSPTMGRLFYPMLCFFRLLLLKMLGRQPIA